MHAVTMWGFGFGFDAARCRLVILFCSSSFFMLLFLGFWEKQSNTYISTLLDVCIFIGKYCVYVEVIKSNVPGVLGTDRNDISDVRRSLT